MKEIRKIIKPRKFSSIDYATYYKFYRRLRYIIFKSVSYCFLVL